MLHVNQGWMSTGSGFAVPDAVSFGISWKNPREAVFAEESLPGAEAGSCERRDGVV